MSRFQTKWYIRRPSDSCWKESGREDTQTRPPEYPRPLQSPSYDAQCEWDRDPSASTRSASRRYVPPCLVPSSRHGRQVRTDCLQGSPSWKSTVYRRYRNRVLRHQSSSPRTRVVPQDGWRGTGTLVHRHRLKRHPTLDPTLFVDYTDQVPEWGSVRVGE